MTVFNVKVLYIYKFISQCLPIYAFYTILFIERGQSVTNIAVLIALWSVFTIVFEIPSGIAADRWNRRNMLVLAAVLQGSCFLIWYFSHTFLMFLLGFVCWAFAEAFTSGTEEGLIYDNLKSDGCEDSFAKVYGKARFCANAGIVAGIVSAGIAVEFINVDKLALISAAICFFNIIFVIQLREKNFYSERLSDEAVGFFDTLRSAGTYIKGSGGVLSAIVFLALFSSLGSYLDEFDALIINDFQLSKVWVSIILTVRFIFVSLGDILAPFVQRKITSVKQIYLLNGLACICLIIFAVIWNQFLILFFGLSFMIMAITEILLIDVLQNGIKEEGRSTVMSFCGVGQNMAMICFSLVYALLAGIFTLQQVYIIISCYGILGVLGFCLLLKRKRR